MIETADKYDLAQDFTALLALGGDLRVFPVNGNIIDLALSKCIDGLSKDLSDQLTFSGTGPDRTCDQLPDILQAAEELGIISRHENGPDEFTLKLSRDSARLNAIRAESTTSLFEQNGAFLVETILKNFAKS